MKKIFQVIGWVLFLSILFSTFLLLSGGEEKKYKEETPLDIYFLETHNESECIIIKRGDVNIMIDAGAEEDSKSIAQFLEDKNINKIDYLILTNPDSQHFGNAVDIINKVSVENVIEPYYAKENIELEKLNKEIEEMNIPIFYPLHNKKIYIGDFELIIYPPLEGNYNLDNNYSLVTLLNFNDINILFTGNVQRSRIEEMLMVNWTKIDLLEVPNHGKVSKNSVQLLEKLKPGYAVIISNKADEEIVKALSEIGTDYYYNTNGTIKVQIVKSQLKIYQ